ncbi:hypothetical protein M3N55_11415 [Roseibaca sp. V10]|uniref:DUF7742 domain-containing protein n=1 Tax=Roseinatronobacter domitianus TaxID=2940293 RepID=A0ABT0M3B5_9RHOB|nr:hypothetical protein [Roseibaca domitiana]MCL1629343.1 hypothetical protein [Roseibaca domitiana]
MNGAPAVAPTRPPRAATVVAALAPRRARECGCQRMRPVTPGDIMAAARVLLLLPEEAWEKRLEAMLSQAEAAECHRTRTGRAHPRYGNGTLMSVATPQGAPPAMGDRRFLAAMGALIAAVLARSESLEGHGRQCAADAGNVEERF